MGRASCVLVAIALCAGVASAEMIQFTITDSNGSQVTGCPVGVSKSGKIADKLPPAADGIYSCDVKRGEKLTFEVIDPALAPFNKVEIRVPLDISGPVQVQLPPAPGTVQGTVPNDECPDAIDVGPLPALVAGDTTSGTLDSAVAPFCVTSVTAPGIWYSVLGTGNDMIATTCNLLTPPGSATYDTKISVYCLGCDGLGPRCVFGNDDQFGDGCGGNFASTVEFSTQIGREYLILVHGFGAASGAFELSIFEGGGGSPFVDCTPPEPEGACCEVTCNDPHTIECSVVTETECAAMGRTYQGDDTPCFAPNGDTVFAESSPAANIPDNGGEALPLVDTVTIGTEGCEIADLTVDVIITHTWISDVQVNLTGPNGLTSNLFDQRCGSADNLDVTFADGGTSTLCSDLTAPGVGTVDPLIAGLGPALSQFDGSNPTGDWTLSVNDNFAADTGTLDFWRINIECGEQNCAFPVYTCGGFDVFEESPGVFTAPGFPGNLIVGTEQDDNLFGTSGPDLMILLGGRDEARGLGGDDVICGGPGRDEIHGDGGADMIFGEEGQDELYGENGADTIRGGPGRDDINGDGGPDMIFGDDGPDLLVGGDGGDTLEGNNGDDTLEGGNGGDTLDGGAGNDACSAGDAGSDSEVNCEV